MITEVLMSSHGRDGTLLHMSAQVRNPVTELQLGADELRGYLQSRLAAMSSSEADVLRLVIHDPQFAAEATTAQLAERAGVSPPTVVRAARAAGFDGFADLKLGLAYARGSARFFTPPRALDAASTPREVVSTVMDGGRRALSAAEGILDAAAISNAAERIVASGRVIVVGAGTSAAVAADIAFRLTTVGIAALNIADHMSALVAARLLREGDVVLAFSATGKTPHTVSVCDAATSSGASLVAITNQAQSPLALLADVSLAVGGDDLDDQMAAAASRIAHLTVADAIVSLIALRNPDRVRTAERAGTDLP
jgi:RpiR family carbohydrate utilization transcriptional regulator